MAPLEDLISINVEEKTMSFNLIALAPFVGSLVRHGVTVAGGILVAKGLADQGAVDQAASGLGDIVGGSAIYLIGQALSFIKAKKNLKK